LQSYVPPPEMANTPPSATTQQGYMLPSGDTAMPQGYVDALVLYIIYTYKLNKQHQVLYSTYTPHQSI